MYEDLLGHSGGNWSQDTARLGTLSAEFFLPTARQREYKPFINFAPC